MRKDRDGNYKTGNIKETERSGNNKGMTIQQQELKLDNSVEAGFSQIDG